MLKKRFNLVWSGSTALLIRDFGTDPGRHRTSYPSVNRFDLKSEEHVWINRFISTRFDTYLNILKSVLRVFHMFGFEGPEWSYDWVRCIWICLKTVDTMVYLNWGKFDMTAAGCLAAHHKKTTHRQQKSGSTNFIGENCNQLRICRVFRSSNHFPVIGRIPVN